MISIGGKEACAGVLGASVGIVGTTELVGVHAKVKISLFGGDGFPSMVQGETRTMLGRKRQDQWAFIREK